MKAGFEKIILFCLIFASFVAFSLSVDNFSCQQINTSAVSNVTKAGTTSLYNFSVTTTGNFTSLNLTLPTEFTYINASANSSLYLLNWTCANYTANTINCSCNASLNGTSSIYVWFNATSPSYSNETWFNFTVFVSNETNHSTKNTLIGNDGNITFIGNISGVTNDTIIQNQNITIYALVNDSFAGINLSKTNSVQVLLCDYTTGDINATYNTSNDGQNNFSATFDTGHLNDGAYNISIYAIDQVGNHNYSNTSYYFNVTPQPDLIVTAINWTSVYGGNYPFSQDGGNYTNFTINITVKNNGTAKAVNITTILFQWDSYSITKNISSLNADANQIFNYTIIGNATNANNGVHTITATLDTHSNQTEKNETNVYTEILYIGYNVTVLRISPSSVIPGGNINISVKVLYGNGSVVDNLTKDDFKIYDKWASNSHIYTSSYIQSIDRTQNTSGIYNITYKVNSSIYSSTKVSQHGIHYLNVGVEKGNYSGWNNDTNNNYTINASNLEIRFSGVDTTLTKDIEDEFRIQYRNTGNIEITNISIRIYTNNSNINIKESSSGSYDRGYTCSSPSPTNLGYSTTYTDCPALKLKGTSVGEYKLYFTYAYGAATSTGTKYNSTSIPSEIITVSAAATNDDDTTTTDTTTTTTTTAECTVNSNCSSTYFCNSSNKCQKRTCNSNQLVSNHNCVTITINTIYNDTFYIKQGENITVPFYLNSTKYKISSVYLKAIKPVEYRGNVSISPSSQTLIKNTLKQYNITFTMPKDALFKKEYNITIKVKKGTTKTFAAKNITLIVSGGNATKTEISKNIIEYEETLKTQLTALEDIKSKLDKDEQSLVQARTDKINKIMDEIRALIENEEYLKADKKINELNLELENLNNSINALIEKTADKTKKYKIYTFVVLIIAGLSGLGYYMMLPDKEGYHPTKGFVKKSRKTEFKEQAIEKIDDAVEKIQAIFKKKEESPLKKRAYNYHDQLKKK